MRQPALFGSLLTFSISLGLVACGAGSPPVATAPPATPAPVTPAPPPPPTTLTGNWLLAGSRVPATYPVLSTSLVVQGTTISGQIAVSAQCGGSGTLPSTVSAEGFPISGTIASDGTFQATTQAIGVPPNGVLTLSLTGASPLAATPSTWTGTYSLTFTPGTSGVSCSIAQRGTFVANAIANVTGTYTGVATSTNAPFGMAADVSVQLTQGAPTLVTQGNSSYYQLPLTGSLTIANSPCFTAPVTIPATATVTAPAFVSGDSLQLVFLTTSTQGEGLNGKLTDSTANTFSGLLANVGMAGCGGGIGAYTFTRK